MQSYKFELYLQVIDIIFILTRILMLNYNWQKIYKNK